MSTYVFKITCLTNLHAGSGDSGGFGVVDKTVQRDPATNLPTIHASGLKGALREHFSDASWENRVFGSNQKSRQPGSSERGSYHFFTADLLALPKPDSAPPYFKQVSTLDYINDLKQKYEALGAKGIVMPIVSFDPDFLELAEELPVIARNQLDNGVSQNLWYEEVVPRQSSFLVAIQVPDDEEEKKAQTSKDSLIHQLTKAPIQIGGNATVGYGFCSFTQIYPKP